MLKIHGSIAVNDDRFLVLLFLIMTVKFQGLFD